MPVDPLRSDADLEHLRRTAKVLRDLVRAGVTGAIDLAREHHPRLGELSAAAPAALTFQLSDAQLTIARHHGFVSWPKLRRHVEMMTALARSPHEQPAPVDDTSFATATADDLVRLACLTYGADSAERRRRGVALLAAQPDLGRATFAAAVTVADVGAVRDALVEDPGLATALCGPFEWEPLLYVAYSRVGHDTTGRDALEVARLLLAAGADPDAGYLWEGLVPPFTALTGSFGGGEGGQPRHPAGMALATLLLAAGADPNDGQTVYDNGLGDTDRDDTDWLELLLAHGFGTNRGGRWYRTIGDQLDTPAELAAEVLHHAADHGLRRRVRLLLDHGVDPNRGGNHRAFRGRTPYEGALAHGNLEIAGWLVAAGATTSEIDPVEAAVGQLLTDDRDVVVPSSAVVASLGETRPALVRDAAELGRIAAVRRIVALGFDVNDLSAGSTALHTAAWRNDAPLVRALLDLGADPTIVDVDNDSTPAGWAEHAGHADLTAELAEVERRWRSTH